MFDIRVEQQKLLDFANKASSQAEVLLVGFSDDWPANKKKYLEDSLKTFFSNWHAHGKKLESNFFLFCDRFLVVLVDPSTAASGCARDDFFKTMKKLVAEQHLALLNSNDIVIAKLDLSQGEQQLCNFITLQRHEVGLFVKKQSGEDLSKISLIGFHLSSVKQIRAGELVQPFHKSWLSKFSEPITT